MKKIFLVSAMALTLVACGGNKSGEGSCCSDSVCCADSAKCSTDTTCVCPSEAGAVAQELSGNFRGEFAGGDGAQTVELVLAGGQYSYVETPQAGKGAPQTTKGTYSVAGDVLTLTSEAGAKTSFKVQDQSTLVLLGADNQLPEKPEMYTLRLATK